MDIRAYKDDENAGFRLLSCKDHPVRIYHGSLQHSGRSPTERVASERRQSDSLIVTNQTR